MYSCAKCSPCCQDTQEHDVEPQCLRQGFPRDRACRYTGRNCGGLEPTSTNTVFKTTPTLTQELERYRIPSSYIIGGIVSMVVLLVMAVLITCLLYRVYCDIKHKPRVALRLNGTWIYFLNMIIYANTYWCKKKSDSFMPKYRSLFLFFSSVEQYNDSGTMNLSTHLELGIPLVNQTKL